MLIRLRLPGGQSTGGVLAGVARLAERYGSGEVQLTTRAGLQIRGLPDPLPARLVGEIAALGLLPSAAHDRVRNIVASPCTGIVGGCADLRGMITELDRALIADPELADLPGRFLFALDDGTGDVSELPFDLGLSRGGSRPRGGAGRLAERPDSRGRRSRDRDADRARPGLCGRTSADSRPGLARAGSSGVGRRAGSPDDRARAAGAGPAGPGCGGRRRVGARSAGPAHSAAGRGGDRRGRSTDRW